MESELQELREMMLQLRADNDRLLQERVEAQRLLGASSQGEPIPSTSARSFYPDGDAPVVERLLYVPRERKCPKFRGRFGMGLVEWMEEVHAGMRVRQLSTVDQAYFIYDHLEGEAKEEIKFRPRRDREDPAMIVSILQELYGCAQSYVALQEQFFSRKQLDGESLLEYSHALFALMEKVVKNAPNTMPNSEILLRDQFIENVNDCTLRRELRQVVRRHPEYSLLDVRGEAIRWEREGRPNDMWARGYSRPCGNQCQVQRNTLGRSSPSHGSEMAELRERMRQQQEQLNQLSQTVLALQNRRRQLPPHSNGPVICRRCERPGHFARNCDNDRAVPQATQSQKFGEYLLSSPGTLLSETLKAKMDEERQGAVTQEVVTAFTYQSAAELSVLQESDPTIGAFLRFWRRRRAPDHDEKRPLSRPVLELLRQWDRVMERDGLLYRRIYLPDGGAEVIQLVLPEALRKEVLTQLHDDHGHQGVERTTELVRQRCYWPRMHQDIKRWCQGCEPCTLAKATQPQEPQLPIDSLLGRVEEPAPGRVDDWMEEHQRRLQIAYEGARDKLKGTADRRKGRHDQKAGDQGFKEEQLVYRRDHGVRGKNKIQDQWSPTLYKILKAPKGDGPVYTIAPLEHLERVKRVHRTSLTRVPQNLSPDFLTRGGDKDPGLEPADASSEEGDWEDGDWWLVENPLDSREIQTTPLPVPVVPAQEASGPSGVMPQGTILRPANPTVTAGLVQDGPGPSGVVSRRTMRATAGRHKNIHHLPEATNSQMLDTSSMTSALFRPWHQNNLSSGRRYRNRG